MLPHLRQPCLEALESRHVLAVGIVAFDAVAGSVKFSGDLGGTTSDNLVLGESGGLLTHNATVGNYFDNTDIDPGPGIAHLTLTAAVSIVADMGIDNDLVSASGITTAGVTLLGGPGNDILIGTQSPSPIGDRLEGGSGDDVLSGLAGNDILLGGSGQDQLNGGPGDDTLEGGDDSDTITTGTGVDTVDGGGGADVLTFSAAPGTFDVSRFGSNVKISASGDGSNTGASGAANIETLQLVSTTDNPSSFNIHDLSGTTLLQMGIDLPTGLRTGTTVRVEGTQGADTITAANETIFQTSTPAITLPWGQVAFVGAASTTVTMAGLAGDDQIAIGPDISPNGTSFVLDGGFGNDTLTGGSNSDRYLGGDGDDTLIASGGSDIFDGGDGFDTILVQGTAGNDAIDVFQTPPTANVGDNYELNRTVNGTAATLLVTVSGGLAPNDASARPTVEAVRIEGQAGSDTIRVGHADQYTDDNLTNGLVAQIIGFSVDGGPGATADRLIVRDDGTGDLVLVRQSAVPGSGSVTVAPAVNTSIDDVQYENIERVDVLPVDPVTGGTGDSADGRVVVFQPDPFEMNDNRLVATDFTDLATTNLNPTIDPGSKASPFHGDPPLPGDEDWYVYQATQTSTLRFDVRFDTIATVPSGRPGLPGNGVLDAAVYDSTGTLIASGAAVSGFGSQVVFGSQAGQRYFLRVKGAALADNSAAINTYTLGVTNLDTSGPVVTSLSVTGQPAYNLFNAKSSPAGTATPTPLISSLSIGIQDLPARGAGFNYPALLLPGTVTAVEPNNSIATAQNVDGFFNLAQDPNIGDQASNTSTTIPHTTITATGNGTFDYYSFTIGAAGTTAIFDIDFALNAGASIDTEIFLYDKQGNLLDSNDDANVAFGAGGSISAHDPFLQHTFTAPGVYVIGVGRFSSTGSPGGITGTPLATGDSYTLQVSIPNHPLLLNPGLFQVVGDNSGIIPIKQVQFIPDPIVAGQPPSGTIQVQFFSPLPDDRFTLTVFDSLTDPAGNKLDGESNASQAQNPPQFPSGNGVPGGNFVARFTVDSRPEIAVYVGNSVTADMNGNGGFDPANADATNRDLVFQFGNTSDQRFAGKLVPAGTPPAFDVLAAFGRPTGPGSSYRFLIDYNGNGRVDNPAETINSPVQVSALAVAGNFDGNAANGDEVALFTGTTWYILSNNLQSVLKQFNSPIQGFPIAGDFDGDGQVDLGTYQNGTFNIIFGPSFNGPAKTVSFASPGVLNRPVAADMDGDGITDLGLWLPYSGTVPGIGEFRFLISNDLSNTQRVAGTVTTLNHGFSPAPLGVDVAYHFGNPTALPLVGNFDPPPATGSTTSGSSAPTSAPAPVNPTPTPPQQPTVPAVAPLYALSQARSIVASLYHDILGRAPDPSGWDTYTVQLESGVARETIAGVMLTSPEHYSQAVEGFYATYLHRHSDPGGLSSWTDRLLHGTSEAEVAIDFIMSSEYAQLHSGQEAFVDALYNDVLGRASDSGGRSTYVGVLQAGSTAVDVVTAFFSSTEYKKRIIDQLYTQILHRPVDPSGVQSYLAKLQSAGYTPRSMERDLVASDEYFARSSSGN
jgi:Ca2+-binding RTX toxin-like protein